ncbi:ABC transporter ATP-binding protein [Pectobacterium phage POP12]|nr:ABC transporter ATP-binding protein [Pectobacterium phage POP12]
MTNRAFRELIKIAVVCLDEPIDSPKFIGMMNDLGVKESFVLHLYGLKTESIKLFEQNMFEMK